LTNLEYLVAREGTDQDFTFVRNQFSDSDEKISKTLISNQIDIVKSQIEAQESAHTKLSLSIALGVLSLLIIGGYFYARQKIRTDRLLLAQQQQIIGQQEQLHLSELDNLLRQQEIEFIRKRLEGEEAECRRIARELHDGVGGLLVSAKWNLESALEEAAGSNGMIAAKLKDNLHLQDESYQELRKVVRELERDRIPWWEELQKFCERLSGNRQTGIRFYRHGLDESAGGALGEEARLITQELITNALKHANASQINVQIGKVDHILSIVVEDNGKGFDKTRSYDGSGLSNIAERVNRLSGNLSFETGEGSGTSVFVDIPLIN
ncbi:MAG TPA: histidine kinase, partial [Saprospiraceae bacterium]|nr:histidine kinase [Saprospiraceae bacterium]